MPARPVHRLSAVIRATVKGFCRRVVTATRPAVAPLVAANALLRHQLVILRRGGTRPRWRPADRALLVLLAGRVRTWRSALLIAPTATLLRWQRQLLRRPWRRQSRAAAPAHRPPLAPETVAPIRRLAADNRLWGAERIRGELLKLALRVAQSTIQKCLRDTRQQRPSGQACSGRNT